MADGDKPAFDPSQPFAPVADKPPFDSSAPFQAAPQTGLPTASLGASALDVAKQLPTGVAVGAEAIPGAMPTVMHALGRGAEWGIRKLGLETPEVAEQIRAREALLADNPRWSVANLLPQPQTQAGQYARTVGEFAPAALAGRGSLARRVATQDVLPAVASEAAGQATSGTPYEPYARIGAAATVGFPFGRWRTQPTSPAPLVDDLFDAGSDAYRRIRESGFALKPEPVANLGDRLESALTERGFSDQSVPETFGVLRRMQAARDAPPGAVVTASNLDTARQQLLMAARNTTNLREGPAAWDAIGKIDDYLANVPAGHVASGDAKAASDLFFEARGNWAAAKRAEMVAAKIQLGDLNASTAHSGTNVDNATRQAVKQLIRPNKYGKTLADQHGFSDDEIGAMNDVARGTATTNTLRYVGNLLGGGGGFGQLAMAGVGLGASYETSDPAWLALPAIGAAARFAAGRLTQAQTERLLDQVTRRSPLGAETLRSMTPTDRIALMQAAALRAGTNPTPSGAALPGLPLLQGPGIGRTEENQNQVPRPPAQQQHGGAVGGTQQRAKGGHVTANNRNPRANRQALPRIHPHMIEGARKARDGKWYVSDPRRPGKYLLVENR